MGLVEQIRSGSIFKRNSTAIVSGSSGVGFTTDLGATYILLGISSTAPCRVRLYFDEASRIIDSPRPSSSFEYSASVGLNLDAALTPGTSSITFNPPVLATTRAAARTYYHIESTTNPTVVTLKYYPIEYDVSSRKFMVIPNTSGVTLTANQTSSGNFSTPKSFLMFLASSNNTDIRLRLYSKPIENISNTEKNRGFTTQSADDSYLISDMLFDSASYSYMISPILQAYNLENYVSASNRVGYILENTSGTTKSNTFASIGIYPIEGVYPVEI